MMLEENGTVNPDSRTWRGRNPGSRNARETLYQRKINGRTAWENTGRGEEQTMEKIRKAFMVLLAVCLLSAAAAAGGETYVEQGGQIPDGAVYQGYWKNAYLQILNNHSAAIHQYQNRTIRDMYFNGREYTIPCMPVRMQDLNGDGIPELLFLEAASGGARGDLYIYSGNGSSARCVLYVPGITRLDYDEMLGFSIYLSTDSGNTLVVEHYQYETPWILQFFMSGSGRYELLNYLTIRGDYSGEGYDLYYRNGMQVSGDVYYAVADSIQNGRYSTVSDYFRTDYSGYGLETTWESAVNTLGGQSGRNTPAPAGNTEVYGLTIDKLATRKGPGTQYDGGGTYSVKGQYIKVLAKAYDKRNGIWWVKCEIPYHGEIRVLWTGYKRFDKNTLSLDDLPEEFW